MQATPRKALIFPVFEQDRQLGLSSAEEIEERKLNIIVALGV